MNFYDAELVKDNNGKYAVELENVRVTLSDEKQENLTRNQAEAGPVTLGVRPEHLHLADGTEAKIDGMVEVSEMMGSAVHLHLKACGTDTDVYKRQVLLACVLINVPLIIWFLLSFFQELPDEVEESAKVDGATEWQDVYKRQPFVSRLWDLYSV